jgi:hypothetical protein
MRAVLGLSTLCIAFSSSFELASLSLIGYIVLVEIGMPVRQAFATEIAGISVVGSFIGISNFIRTMLDQLHL